MGTWLRADTPAQRGLQHETSVQKSSCRNIEPRNSVRIINQRRLCSICRPILRMRRVFRLQRKMHVGVVNLPIDIFQHLRIDVVGVNSHLILSSVSSSGRLKREPIASARHEFSVSLEGQFDGFLTYTHPQLSQKSKETVRSPQMYFLVMAPGFVSILTSSGL